MVRSSLLSLAVLLALAPAQAQVVLKNSSGRKLTGLLAKPVSVDPESKRDNNKPYSLVIDGKEVTWSAREFAIADNGAPVLNLKNPATDKDRFSGVRVMDGNAEIGKFTLRFTKDHKTEVIINRNPHGALTLDSDGKTVVIQKLENNMKLVED